jgi:ATP-dependent Clp protease adaptor protein ClpS
MASNSRNPENVIEKGKVKSIPPPLYKVILINDDFTPMDFVVKVLRHFFFMDEEMATRIMLQVHTEGAGVCGTYPGDIAATKVQQVNEFSKQNQHPLMCVMEKE